MDVEQLQFDDQGNVTDKKTLMERFKEHEQNTEMKRKMELIQKEVKGFNTNIDKFASICDQQLENLLDNIDTIT